MKTFLQKSIFVLLLTILCLGFNQQVSAQTNNYFGTSGTLSGNVWSTSVGGPYTSAFSVAGGGGIMNFGNTTTSITGGSITVAGINATANATITSIGGTISNQGNGNVPVNVSSGITLDFAGNAMTTSGTASYTKNGAGIFALGGATWGGGFTLNNGTIVARGVNCMGQGGVLTINGGTIAGSGTRDFTGKFSNIVVNSDFTLGSTTSPAVGTSNLTFSNTMALGTSTSRTITIGGTGTYTLGGVISGSSSNLTVASTAAGIIVLTGANTYNGLTTVSGGTLQLNRTGGTTLPTGNSVVVNSGATLRITTAQQLNNVTVDAGGTLIVDATLTVTGTCTINGNFQINQGGFATGGTWAYGSNATLIFNQTSGAYGVSGTPVFWPASGLNNVTVQGGGAINMTISRTVPGTFLLVAGTNAVQGTALTLNGTTQINGGNFQSTPTYGSASTLVYNTTYGTSNEWTGGATPSVAAGSGIPANVQVLSGTVTLGGGRGVPGNVTVTAGGMVLNATSGDLYLGGNLTHSGTTWTNNGRAVVFVGTGTSVINTSANSGVHFFDYLLVNKSSGSVQIGNTTNVTLNTTAGSVLQFLNAGTLDLNGRTLTMNNNGGNILADGTNGGTTKSIISSTGTGTIAVTNGKTASGTAGGTLSTSSTVTWLLTGGMNFGGVTTVNGVLQINAGGFVTTNAPIYGTGSLLKYNTAANPFNRTTEWSASSGAGYPYNVQISNNTTLSPGGTGNTGTALNVANNLIIDSGSNLYMDFGGNNMTVPLTVNNDITITGNLSASGVSGGDVIVRGNWTRTGAFGPNGRAVFFQGTNAQSITGATTFDFLLMDKTSGSVTLNNNITANQTVTFTATNVANIITGSNKVIIANSGSITRTGSGHVNGNLQKNIPTGTNSRTFEIGDAAIYTPVITAYTGVTGSGNITVRTDVNDHPQIASSGINSTKSVNRYYTISNTGVTGGSYNATFTFVAGDIDGGADTNSFVVGNYVNPTWTIVTTGTKTSTTTQATGLTSYGDFQLGESLYTTWTGGASTTAWLTSGNWTNGVPNSLSNVTISTASFYPEITSNVTINSLLLDSGTTLKVIAANNLTVTDAIQNDGTLTIENTANLKQVNNVSNSGSGTAIVRRTTATLMRQDYVLWSSPVTGQQLQSFSPATLSNRFYTYDPSTDNYVAETATNNFTTGKGYLIRLPNNHPVTPTVWNGQFVGTNFNNGTVTINSLTANTYNAVGNPYSSSIDADLFIGGNTLTDAMYFWRKSNNSANPSYATYTLAGGIGTAGSGDPLGLVPNGEIQAGQGFIVKTGATTSLQFTNTMRTTDNGGLFFRASELERNRIWLNVSNTTGIFSQTLISYMENATSGFDNTIDGRFFNDSQNALTSIINNEEYAIQGRALPFEASDVVALGFKSELPGEYSIAIDHVDGFFTTNEDIFLRDNVTNMVHDLRIAPYTFTTEAGVFNSRFELLYQNPLGVGNPTFNANQVVIYKNATNDFVINSGNVTMATVKVFDIRGRLLVERKAINATQTTIQVGLSNEVLLVQITSEDGILVTKKVVR